MSTPVIAGDTLPVARWTAAARARRSRRSYGPVPINGPEAECLEEFCRAFMPFEGARTVLVAAAPPKIFTGWLLGVYGKVTSPSALVFVGDRRRFESPARTGYTGEAAVLEATALGLATCWIGGGVRRGQVTSLLGLAPHEHVHSISALGYAPEKKTAGERATARIARAHRRRPLEEFAPGYQAWPRWAQAGLELVRISPSATNRQPWRFRLADDGRIMLSFEGVDTPVISKRLDCGIAMLHFELGVRETGARGYWDLLADSPAAGRDVARWIPGAAAAPRLGPPVRP